MQNNVRDVFCSIHTHKKYLYILYYIYFFLVGLFLFFILCGSRDRKEWSEEPRRIPDFESCTLWGYTRCALETVPWRRAECIALLSTTVALNAGAGRSNQTAKRTSRAN